MFTIDPTTISSGQMVLLFAVKFLVLGVCLLALIKRRREAR